MKYNELAEYVNLKVSKGTTVIQFRKDNHATFPKLYDVAHRVLCITATSAASERVFSVAGRTLEKRRTSLQSVISDGNFCVIKEMVSCLEPLKCI